ncbi:unnamed protein product [Caenorhabditis brenneri]
MGQCLSGYFKEDTAGSNYRQKQTVKENRVPTELEKLEKSPAGLTETDPRDNYFVDLYSNGVQDIFNQINNLRTDFDTIIDRYCQKMPTSNDYLTFNTTYDELIGKFYRFFRYSVYKMDEHVQLRKDMAVKALHEARRFKAEVDKQINLPHPNFNVCRDLGLQLYIAVDELYDHFFDTFTYAPKGRRASLISIALKDNAARGGG